MEDPEFSQLILGRTWQKGTRAIIDMDDEAQPVEWNFADGFIDEDENQFLDDQPYIVPVAEVNLVPLTDEEKRKELRKYLKSIKRKMMLGAPPQVPAYPEEMNFREDQFRILDTPRQIDETPAEQAVQEKTSSTGPGLVRTSQSRSTSEPKTGRRLYELGRPCPARAAAICESFA
ncbi:hypothetical protein R1flu_025996 [Riccia fluitans]|uniref:Uncharacterized protein n=1 Tax=Riccia fluitans TaxID=41844 RepID=A0ABD1XIQ8_9MARC